MKKFLYVILALVLVYFIIALFGPKEMKVERSISINKPSSLVTSKLADYRFFHDDWSPFTALDPNMKTSYKGNPGEIGHSYRWEGNKEAGSGEMEIKAFNGDSLLQRVTFDGMGDSKSYFIAKDKSPATEVSWGIMFEIGFLFRPMALFMNMEKQVGAEFEKGLATLKTKLESMKAGVSAASNHEVKEVQWEARTFYGTKKTKMDGAKLAGFFGENFPKMWLELEKEKIQSCMSPCGLFYSWDEKTMATECAAAFCVPNDKQLKGWEKYSIPASKVLHAPHYGAPEKSIEAHYAIDAYMKERKLDYTFVIEEYVTDPTLEKDTARWLTNIYYILK